MAVKYQTIEEAAIEPKGTSIRDVHPCDAFHPANRAIALAYFSVGLVMSFAATPLNVYLVSTLGAEPTMQNTIGILQTLPWSLKLIFGFISDTTPIMGMHRKPYLFIGAIMYSMAYLLYSLSGQNNVTLLAICIFFATLGLVQMDVMADTMCVERSKFEPEEIKGQMQSTFYSIRFSGGLLGALLGACVSNQKTWGWGLEYREVAFINAMLPFILVVPWLFTLREKYKVNHLLDMLDRQKEIEMGNIDLDGDDDSDDDDNTIKPPASALTKATLSSSDASYQQSVPATGTSGRKLGKIGRTISIESIDLDDTTDDTSPMVTQLHEIWQTVQLRSVWRPMCFVYIFNLFQVPNVAWQSYLQLNLEFPSWVLGLTVLLGSFMTFAGVLAYKYFLFGVSWRKIYIWSACLTSFFSLLQLILIFGINKRLGINDYFFSLGDDVITAYISGIQFLPICIMYMRLCPEGAEGASYAMLTTFGNIAMVCASNVGNLISGIWDVSNEAMREHDINGLWKLSVLTSTVALLPLCLLFLLPKDPADQARMAASRKRSKPAGILFLCVLLGSLMWTTSTAIYRVMNPTVG